MIEVKTKYDLNTHKEFFRFLFFGGKYYRYKQPVFAIIGAFMVMLWFIFFFIIPESFIANIFLAIGVVLVQWAYMMPVVLSRQNAKEVAELSQTGLDIVFDERRISIKSAGESPEETSALPYEKVFGVYEAKNDFYIYITRAHPFIVSKKDFVKGSPDDLRTLFQAKMAKNFVICK